MGQPLTRKEETRRRIVESAVRLFMEKGVDGVGVDEIMRDAGLTHGGFYVHFPSKEALVTEACECALDNASAKWKGIAAKLADPDLFHDFINDKLSGSADGPACPMALLGPDVSRRSDSVQGAYVAKLKGIIDLITRELGSDRDHAILTLAALVGATSLSAQAGADKALATEILETTRQELLKCRPNRKKLKAVS